MNINGIISYLNSQYSFDNRDQITFIENFPSQRDIPFLESISEELKAISEFMKGAENISLKNKCIFGGSLSVVGNAHKCDKLIKEKNLPQRFDD